MFNGPGRDGGVGCRLSERVVVRSRAADGQSRYLHRLVDPNVRVGKSPRRIRSAEYHIGPVKVPSQLRIGENQHRVGAPVKMRRQLSILSQTNQRRLFIGNCLRKRYQLLENCQAAGFDPPGDRRYAGGMLDGL